MKKGWIALLGFLISASPAWGADDYDYVDFKLSSPTPQEKSAPAARGKKTKKKSAGRTGTHSLEGLAIKAIEELEIPASEQSSDLLPTPATVRSRVEPVRSPVRRAEFEMGLSFQMYEPSGRSEAVGFDTIDLGRLGSQPLVSLDFRWLPIQFESVAGLSLGSLFSVGYARHPFRVKPPAGTEAGDAHLHTLKTQIGAIGTYTFSGTFSGVLPGSRPWSASLQGGVGRLGGTQSAETATLNQSAQIWYTYAGASIEKDVFNDWRAWLGYENRFPIERASNPSEMVLSMQRSGWLVGVMGSFR